jgi:hypothetical protein
VNDQLEANNPAKSFLENSKHGALLIIASPNHLFTQEDISTTKNTDYLKE